MRKLTYACLIAISTSFGCAQQSPVVQAPKNTWPSVATVFANIGTPKALKNGVHVYDNDRVTIIYSPTEIDILINMPLTENAPAGVDSLEWIIAQTRLANLTFGQALANILPDWEGAHLSIVHLWMQYEKSKINPYIQYNHVYICDYYSNKYSRQVKIKKR
jgi:hypothetical protein